MSAAADARLRLMSGDLQGALVVLAPGLVDAGATDEVLTLAARALRGLGRHDEAVQVLVRLTARAPGNGVAAHNLAAALGDAGDHLAAAVAARKAIALRDAPESWLVLGRALQSAGDLPEARAALEQAVRRRPGYRDALQTLSQLIWMNSGDAEAALKPLRFALDSGPSPELAATTCGAIRDMLGPEPAYAFVKEWTGRGSPAVELAAAAAAARLDPDLQMRHAQAARDLMPDLAEARHAVWTACLARGRPHAVLDEIDGWVRERPSDQVALALRQTALRLAGHPDALTAKDYQRLVRTYDLKAPEGWRGRGAWLDDLAAALRRLHSFKAEPFGQSVRAGVQSRTDPRHAGEPVIDATFERIGEALAHYVSHIDPAGPLAVARTGSTIISGAWSVRLTAGGWHSDHVHPQGWISSAFYVTVPEPEPSEPFGGWLRFGAAPLGPALELPPELRIEPKPGRLVLFPSFLWHGTEPFSGSGERLTLAFDAVPA